MSNAIIDDLLTVAAPDVFDRRTRWDTHLVTMSGGAAAFTDGPIAEA